MTENPGAAGQDKQRARFVSRLTQDTLALVLAGGRGSRLGMLTDWRTKPAVPFGGKYRIIDFTLSNCLNSAIHRICILTQYKSHSLIQHAVRGWGFLNSQYDGFIDIVPAQQWTDEETWYQGTADAVYQTIDIVEGYGPEYVLILAGDHIYTMDYGEMLGEHVSTGADFTVGCKIVPCTDASAFGVMEVDKDNRVVGFDEKPAHPKPMPGETDRVLASMGIYVVSRRFLREILDSDAADTSSNHDFGKDVIPRLIAGGAHVRAHSFHNPAGSADYWRDVGTIDAYYQANLELLESDPPLDLYDHHWPVRTFQPQLPPARFIADGRPCEIGSVMISGGCVVENSRVVNSILSPDVRVEKGCDLDGVLALPGCLIGEGSSLRNVILDNQCHVPPHSRIGFDAGRDGMVYHVSEGGVVVVNRRMLGQGERYLPGMTARF